MFRHSWKIALVAASLIALAGCGGGKSRNGLSGRSLARQRSIASTRLTHAIFSIAGLGQHNTRAASVKSKGMGRRGSAILAAISARRTGRAGSTPILGYDEDTKLYYSIATQPDGSGKQSLFTDTARTAAAGAFTWGAPAWPNNRPDTYPVKINSTYTITEGDLKGMHGEMAFSPVNAEGSAGHIHLGLTTALNETADCELEVEDGMVTTGRDQIRFPDNTSCVEDDSPRGDGGMYCKVEYSDGSKLEMTMAPDGNGTETYTDTSGTVELTGTFDDQSFDDFTYADDSTEQIDTDYWDDSWDDLWDDSSSSSDEVKVKRHTSRSPSHNHTSHTPSS